MLVLCASLMGVSVMAAVAMGVVVRGSDVAAGASAVVDTRE